MGRRFSASIGLRDDDRVEVKSLGFFFFKKMMSARNNRDKNRLNHVKVRDSFGEIPVEFVVMLEFLQAGKLVNIFVYTHIIHIHSSVKNPLVLECRKKQPCFHHEVVP